MTGFVTDGRTRARSASSNGARPQIRLRARVLDRWAVTRRSDHLVSTPREFEVRFGSVFLAPLAKPPRKGQNAPVAGIRITAGYVGLAIVVGFPSAVLFVLAAVVYPAWWLLIFAAALAALCTRTLFCRCWVNDDLLHYRGMFTSFTMHRDEIEHFEIADEFDAAGRGHLLGPVFAPSALSAAMARRAFSASRPGVTSRS